MCEERVHLLRWGSMLELGSCMRESVRGFRMEEDGNSDESGVNCFAFGVVGCNSSGWSAKVFYF